MTDGQGAFRYIGRPRRTKEDGRFVAGRGRYVADIRLPGMKHVALVSSPHASARILSIDTRAALATEGVSAVVAGEELAKATASMQHGVDAPGIPWYPLAAGAVHYAGEWVAAVIADSRYVAEDAAEKVVVAYEPLPAIVDPEEAFASTVRLVHPDHGSNVLFHRKFVWGTVDEDFTAAAHSLDLRVRWGRSSTVPIETFGAVARWDPGEEILDVWASVQMPKYGDQIAEALRLKGNQVRVHQDVDVGGSYGVKRGLKHAILVGYLARKLGKPVRLIEDRLENMSGGDAHGPDRIFDVSVAFDADGTVRSMKMRALDDCGAYPGRAPLQLGKPVGSIVGPYRIASVAYEAISVCTNKTAQVAVRGFGQAPTTYAIETAMDRVADHLGLDRIELRRRNFIRADQFPYMIPSGTEYDSGDYHAVVQKLTDLADYPVLLKKRDAIRQAGKLAGIGIAAALEPGGGNASFEPLFNPRNDTTLWPESCTVKVDRTGAVTVLIVTSSAGQGHQTLAATVVGETLGIDPAAIRVVHSDSLSSLPGNSPVASRMAIMLGGAAQKAAEMIRERAVRIAAHNLGRDPASLVYRDGAVAASDDPSRRLSWDEIVRICHRQYHLMPPGMEPGLQASYTLQVPKGGTMPTGDGRVQMYPCFSFEAHMALVEIDPGTGKVEIPEYYVAHDCGTMINPLIVKGMLLGGIAHGIGAALYERFEYDETGQHLSGTFMDYLLPSSLEIPMVKVADHCTPSPLTSHGQKGAGESGYPGSPAAVASAVNDALAPLGRRVDALPIRLGHLGALFGGLALKSGT
jgi:2-furoyl-CoA dehydrogenase large subunit